MVSLDYRLAPEHKFPTAVERCLGRLPSSSRRAPPSWAWTARAWRVGGDSAGGTLAAVCAILARDAGLPLALAAALLSRAPPRTRTRASHQRFADGPLLGEPLITWFFAQYLDARPSATTGASRRSTPTDVEGVAPAWIGLAECDPVVDEGIAYADKLRAAGVPVDLEIYRGVIHEFVKMGRAIPEALQAHADAARALKEALQP